MVRKTKPKPTLERIQELFHYDPETGVFIKKSKPRTWTGVERKYGKVGAGRISTLGYTMISVDAINYNAGILAWLYTKHEWPCGRIKYLNGCKTDNRIANIFVQSKSRDEVKSSELTQERLKELLHYEPTTGWFTSRVSSSIANIGDRVGGSHGMGYRQIGLDYKKYLEHQLVFLYMTGELAPDEIDHINGDKADNRWENLRAVTRSENGHNKPIHRRNKIGFPGVYLHGVSYRARIHIENNAIDLGSHKTIAEARVARLLSEIENFGYCTSFNEQRDTELPSVNGKTVHIELQTTDCRGVRSDGLVVLNNHGVPFWVKGVETITGIIEASLDDVVH